MRWMIGACMLLVVTCYADEEAKEDDAWIQDGLAAQIEKFPQITLVPHPKQKSIVAANCEHETQWWGHLKVFHHTGDKVDWVATLPDEYSRHQNNYLKQIQWVHLEKLDKWVLEIFDSSHMGNGSLRLLTLEGRELKVLLQTRAVDNHWGDERIFRYGRLFVNYRVPEGGTVESVYLTGTVVTLKQHTQEERSSQPYAEAWDWDAKLNVFSKVTP